MIVNNLYTKNNIQEKYIDKNCIKKFSKNFNKIFEEINNDINDSNKTLNMLSNNFEFSIKIKNLQKFKKYKSIAMIGMGGSILGAEAITKFLEKKIKKKIYFFDNLDLKQISDFKKKKKF